MFVFVNKIPQKFLLKGLIDNGLLNGLKLGSFRVKISVI